MSTWRRFAACRDKPTEWWFPENDIKGKPVDYGPALAICATCPAIAACREEHLTEETGVWGGLVPADRRKLARRRRPVLFCPGCGARVAKGRRLADAVVWCEERSCQDEAYRRDRERRNGASRRRRNGRVA